MRAGQHVEFAGLEPHGTLELMFTTTLQLPMTYSQVAEITEGGDFVHRSFDRKM
jgi:hypothetical protein